MAISYDGLWKKLIDKKMNKTKLRLATGISTSTLAKLAKQEPVTLEILEKICKVLDCNIGDIVEFVKDKE
jgi:DNA (cytosine-5)-methyltransferase 1